MLTTSLLLQSLAAVGDVLRERDQPASIFVVGGAALLLSDFTHRAATVDVDVLAWVDDGVLRYPAPLPDNVRAAAALVAESYGLGDGWMNAVVARSWADHWPPWLPADALSDARRLDFGGLTVYLAGRRTLIPLKLHATVDQATASSFAADGCVAQVDLSPPDARRHLLDLVAMAPTDDELRAAVDWVRIQDGSPDLDIFLNAVLAHVRLARR